MRTRRTSLIMLLALLVAGPLAVTGNATAAERPELRLVQNGPSLSEAVEQVRRQYRGRIVSARTQVRGGRELHVIKVLTDDGKVKTVRIPGRSVQRG